MSEPRAALASRRSRLGAPARVTGWAIHVPGAAPAALGPGADGSEAVPAGRAHELLGRRGLLYKEPATRLALCAVHRALGLPPGWRRSPGPVDAGTAVVASSNLGNVATVRKVVDALDRGGVREVSPLDAPNASSNVVASTVAIWFGFGGPNLMVCSGATAGLDGVALGSLLLASRRADRVVVVGAEPDDEVSAALHAARPAAGGAPLRAGAAAVVLEPAEAAAGAVLLSPVAPAAEPPPPGDAGLLVGPGGRVDLTAALGDTYGALGVLQVAAAAALVAARGEEVAVVCGDACDGWRVATLRPAPGGPS